MRALVFTEVGKVAIQDAPAPESAPGSVVLDVEVAGSCGSDMSGFLGHSPRRRPPLVLGHELVGRAPGGRRVVANPLMSCGACAACLSGRQNVCGSWRLLGMDRVPGAFADRVALPESQLYDIPEDFPAAHAVIAEPLANIVHLFRLANASPLAPLAVVGAGAMGALAISLARRLGFRAVAAADANDARLKTAMELGASETVNVREPDALDAFRRRSAGSFELVIDCSGVAAARGLALELAAPGGKVMLLGMGDARSELELVPAIRREICLQATFAYTPADFRRSLDLLLAGDVDLQPWTRTLPLECGQQAFDEIIRAPGSTLKMLLAVGI